MVAATRVVPGGWYPHPCPLPSRGRETKEPPAPGGEALSSLPLEGRVRQGVGVAPSAMPGGWYPRRRSLPAGGWGTMQCAILLLDPEDARRVAVEDGVLILGAEAHLVERRLPAGHVALQPAVVGIGAVEEFARRDFLADIAALDDVVVHHVA